MKLLTRTVRNYLLFSSVLVGICTPLFYLAMYKLFIYRMDEELREHKIEFKETITHIKTDADMQFYNLMSKEFLLKPVENLPKNDTLFTEDALDIGDDEAEPHRMLKTGVTLNGQNYEVTIKESMVNNTRLITSIMGIQVIMLVFMLVGFTLINRKLSKTIWGPFYVILDELKKYRIDQNKSLELPHSSTAEFRDLSEVITQLVKKNQEAYQSQKEFTENASHEIQTPLAISRSKLELLSQTKELTQEQAELVGALSEASDRISRLNRNLLLLAKIENQQFQQQEQLDLILLVSKLLKQPEEQLELKNITLNFLHDDSCIVHGDMALLEILLTNLITNSLRHSPEFSAIDVTIKDRILSIGNKGTAFEYPYKIFDRFHRESKSNNRLGLGLAIVKKICDIEGYTITYTFVLSTHHFKVHF